MYVGVIVPTDIILAWIAEQVGFKVEQVSICRAAATSAQQFKQFPYLKIPSAKVLSHLSDSNWD